MIDLDKELMSAIENRSLKTVKECVKNGAKNLDAALIYSCEIGDKKIVKFLAENGAKSYNSSLKWASLYGYKDIVAFLIEKGANNYEDALSLVEGNDVYKTIEYFGTKNPSRRVASEKDYLEVISLLSEKAKSSQAIAIEERE